MEHVFDVVDERGKIIHLNIERWKHITQEHPGITNPQALIDTLLSPQIIKTSSYDDRVRWYYRRHKQRKAYLLVSVKYLNGHGFIITAYFVRNIK
ncbi:hypothetical protein J4219_04185 [Candidatus Woesearchaeota archaeon]|nr:hypothetical protein [Candidatus Woesearchaeota archaeon]